MGIFLQFVTILQCGFNTLQFAHVETGQTHEQFQQPRGWFHEASFVFSFLKVKEGGFLTFGKASLKSCFTKPPLFHLTKDFP